MCLSYSDDQKSYEADLWELERIQIIAIPDKGMVRINEQVKVSVYIINDSLVDCRFRIKGHKIENDEFKFAYDLKNRDYKYDNKSIMDFGGATGSVLLTDVSSFIYIKARSSIRLKSDIITIPFSGKEAAFAVYSISFNLDNESRKSNDFTFHLQH